LNKNHKKDLLIELKSYNNNINLNIKIVLIVI
jgi:hypothetical protein